MYCGEVDEVYPWNILCTKCYLMEFELDPCLGFPFLDVIHVPIGSNHATWGYNLVAVEQTGLTPHDHAPSALCLLL